jgi:hypothetical protein
MTELCDLARKWGTDKALFYTPLYHDLLKDRREKVRRVLEFGIGYPELMLQPVSRIGAKSYMIGASLFMWREYFPNANIYGVDVKPTLLFHYDRIRCFECDQHSDKSLARLRQRFAHLKFDLIVDDGSHIPENQLRTAKAFVPMLADDGIYIIEDAPPRDAEFLTQIPYEHEVHDFGVKMPDLARVVVIRREASKRYRDRLKRVA